jgi:hypothetical protein
VDMTGNLPTGAPQCPAVPTTRVRRPRRVLAIVVCAVVLTAGALAVPVPARAARRTRRRRPNILFVLTDDMTRADLHAMPGVERVIGDHGLRFTRRW